MRRLLGLLTGLLLATFGSVSAQSSEEDALRGMMQSWLAAFNAKDAAALESLYADRIYYANNGNKLARSVSDIINGYRQQFAAAPNLTIDFSEELVSAGPRYGHIAGKYRVNVPTDDGVVSRAFGRVLLIFEKQNDDWKLVVDFDNQGSDLGPDNFTD